MSFPQRAGGDPQLNPRQTPMQRDDCHVDSRVRGNDDAIGGSERVFTTPVASLRSTHDVINEI